MVVNPETKKSKSVPKGLGHFRCTGCGKGCKVTPRKPVVSDPSTPYPSPAVAAKLAQPDVAAAIQAEAPIATP